MSQHRNRVALCIALLLVAACDVEVQTMEADEIVSLPIATQQDLLALVASRDISAIREGLDDIDQRSVAGELVPTLESLWVRDIDLYPDLPWDVLDLPLVRLAVGNALTEAHFNGHRTGHIDAIHSYTRELLQSSNRDVVRSSIGNISWFNDARDVVVLEQIWERNELRRAVMASLNAMCIVEADEAADRLLSDCSGGVCDDIRQARTEFEAWEDASGWCSRL